jgi:penicillin-binding protein 1A
VGYPDKAVEMRSVHGISVAGGTFPAGIWHDFMAVAKGSDCNSFPPPETPAQFSSFYGEHSSTGSAPTTTTPYGAPDTGTYVPPPAGTDDGSSTDGGGGEENGGYDPRFYAEPPQEAPPTAPAPAPPSGNNNGGAQGNGRGGGGTPGNGNE